MSNKKRFDVPVLLLVYKRPDLTKKVLDSLELIKPKRLYVVADGPKGKSEADLCRRTSKLIDNLSWDCKVEKNYADENMGLRKRVSTGITWFFDNVSEGLILEDDCVADATFYTFVSELLRKYRNENKIMSISGDNFLQGKYRISNSYYFTKYAHCWGWATWSRAWSNYDDNMDEWPSLRKTGWLRKKFPGKMLQFYWKNIFDLVYENKINSWAYRWQYSLWLNGAVAINPALNLVGNIGQGIDATNTKLDSSVLGITANKLEYPLRHPKKIIVDEKADTITEKNRFINTRNLAGLFYKKYIK